jgi:hypothetical protein
MTWLTEILLANKIRLDMQIEAILKSKKSSRPKKRKKDADEEALDRFADEEVSRLRDSMLSAAAEDMQANKDKQPATAKLKLLPQVMEVLRKYVYVVVMFLRSDTLLQRQGLACTIDHRQ